MDDPHSRIAVTAQECTTGSPHARPIDTEDVPSATPTYQSRLLQSRNARLSATKLSVTKLGSKIAQRTRSGEALSDKDAMRNKENTPPRSRIKTVVSDKANSSGIGTAPKSVTSDRKLHGIASPKSGGVSPDCTETRRTLTKRHSSPLMYQSLGDKQGLFSSSSDSRSMRLREVSGNEYRASNTKSLPRTSSSGRLRKQRSLQLKSHFDTENYIEHIENELRQAQDALISPTTNKSLQHQLRSARGENDRLKQELAEMRNAFEAEVKVTLEHKATAEAELKRRVKYLEDELEGKALMIEELEYQHEEKRLDSGTLDTLKATIDRLEAEKLSMTEENRSMTKRNEVLSELLAMSPTKTRPPFELRSPIRDKRSGRPMSMIIPRAPSSPTVAPARSYVASPARSSPLVAGSEQASIANEIAPFSLNPCDTNCDTDSDPDSRKLQRRLATNHCKSQSTSDASSLDAVLFPDPGTSHCPLPSSPVHETSSRTVYKRKPRKFMHGSTQLKPLLLSTLRSDTNSQSSTSVLGSPNSLAASEPYQDLWEQDSYFPPGVDLSPFNKQKVSTFSVRDDNDSSRSIADVQPLYQTVDEILAGDNPSDRAQSQDLSSNDSHLGRAVRGNSVSLTELGPSPIHRQFIRNTDAKPYSSIVPSSEATNKSDARLATIDGLTDTRPFDRSPPFDIEALRQLQLPAAYFESLPQHFATNGRVSSVVPEPLFSPSLKRNPGCSVISQPNEYYAEQRSAGLTDHKRRQSRSIASDLIISPRPIGMRHSLCNFLDSASESSRSPLTLSSPRDSPSKPPKSPLSSAAISISRSMTPLDLLNRRQFGARPLAAFTIRTICTALSRCTAFVRDMKSDPLALARKVLANAWFANWKKFGGLSWWVLGLFLPQTRIKSTPQWDWDDFDGEEIAERCCHDDYTSQDNITPEHHEQPLSLTVRTSQPHIATSRDSIDAEVDSKPGWCKSIFLWGKFSIALMLAVGGAVVKGPADMMRDIENRSSSCSHDCKRAHSQALITNGQTIRYITTPTTSNFGGGDGSGEHGSRRNSHTVPLLGPSRHEEDDTDTRMPHLLPSSDAGPPRPPSTFSQASNEAGLENDHTLKPVKLRKRHINSVFQHVYPDGSHSDNTDRRNISRNGSIDDGVLQWPPDLDSIHSTCS